MARISNNITFGSGFNISAQAPIDSRMRVQYESDLTNASTWPSSEAPLYDGLTVTVMETGEIWVLKNKNNYTDKENGTGWVKVGGADYVAGDGIVISGDTISIKNYDTLKNSINDTESLPVLSEENKNNFFRLSENNKVYIADNQKIGIEYSYTRPIEDQINKAFLDDAGDYYYCKGEIKLVCANGTIDGVLWGAENATPNVFTFGYIENLSEYGSSIYFIDTTEWEYNESYTVATNSSLTISDINAEAQILSDYGARPCVVSYYAPEVGQIGNAYINYDDDSASKYQYYYTGRKITLVLSDGELEGWGWSANGDNYCSFLSENKASEIMYNYNISDISDTGLIDIFDIDAVENWSISGDVYTNTNLSLEDVAYGAIGNYGMFVLKKLNGTLNEQFNNSYFELEFGDTHYFNGEWYFQGKILGHFTDGNIELYLWTLNSDSYNINFFSLQNPENLYWEWTDDPVKILTGNFNEGCLEIWKNEDGIWVTDDYSVAEAMELLQNTMLDNAKDRGEDINGFSLYIEEFGKTHIDKIEWKVVKTDDLLVEITYNEIVNKRNTSTLIPGQKYRITDYNCTTTQENTQSAGHAFDIIVEATSENTLSENAKAIVNKYNEIYFSNCKLEAWELKYCLDNNTDRFAWADEDYGKGVIYYMKDDRGNECPYDFKNILFKRNKITQCQSIPSLVGCYASDSNNIYTLGVSNYFYTFTARDNGSTGNSIYDQSVLPINLGNDEGGSTCHDNIIKPYIDNAADYHDDINGAQYLNNIVCFGWFSFENNTCSNTYGTTFGTQCNNITLNKGNYQNYFGSVCENILFGEDCVFNTFESFNKDFIVGYRFQTNKISTNNSDFHIGTSCTNNYFKHASWKCRIGDYFENNNVEEIYNCKICDYLEYSNFGNKIAYIDFTTNYSSVVGTNNRLKNLNILSGFKYNSLTAVPTGITTNANYCQLVGFDSNGNFVVKNPLD